MTGNHSQLMVVQKMGKHAAELDTLYVHAASIASSAAYGPGPEALPVSGASRDIVGMVCSAALL